MNEPTPAPSDRPRGEAPGPHLVVSIHDVGPATASAARAWERALRDLPVPLTWLVVPGPYRGATLADPADDGEDLIGWLRDREQAGDEISLHGWTHRADVVGGPVRRAVGGLVARGAAEFWALDRGESAGRTGAGLEALAGRGFAVTGGTPPGWLSSRQSRSGMADAGLGYVTDHAGLVDLGTGRRWNAPALCHRPATATGRPGGPAATLAERAGRVVLRGASRLVRLHGSVRIGLHPADLNSPALVEDAVTTIAACLDAGAVATTYAYQFDRLRAAA